MTRNYECNGCESLGNGVIRCRQRENVDQRSKNCHDNSNCVSFALTSATQELFNKAMFFALPKLKNVPGLVS